MNCLLRICLASILIAAAFAVAPAADVDEAALRAAVALYASFDDAVRMDFGAGESRTGHTLRRSRD